MEVSGIYIIRNTENNKCYIGQSLKVKDRIRRHKYVFRHNKHSNQYLQAAWNKYGEKAFQFSIYCCVLGLTKKAVLDNLSVLEKEIIKKCASFINGYNLTTGGENHKVSEKTKQKLSESHMGIKCSEYCREMSRKRMKGRIVSKETRQRISEALKGRYSGRIPWNKGKKIDSPPWNKGKKGYTTKPASEERKRKIGNAQKGEKNHNFGKTIPSSVKDKIRASNQGSKCYLAKLNETKVMDIKTRLLAGEKGIILARKYGVHPVQISRIKKGKTWRHVKI